MLLRVVSVLTMLTADCRHRGLTSKETARNSMPYRATSIRYSVRYFSFTVLVPVALLLYPLVVHAVDTPVCSSTFYSV